jgi:hypothetical protein
VSACAASVPGAVRMCDWSTRHCLHRKGDQSSVGLRGAYCTCRQALLRCAMRVEHTMSQTESRCYHRVRSVPRATLMRHTRMAIRTPACQTLDIWDAPGRMQTWHIRYSQPDPCKGMHMSVRMPNSQVPGTAQLYQGRHWATYTGVWTLNTQQHTATRPATPGQCFCQFCHHSAHPLPVQRQAHSDSITAPALAAALTRMLLPLRMLHWWLTHAWATNLHPWPPLILCQPASMVSDQGAVAAHCPSVCACGQRSSGISLARGTG